MTSRIRRKLEWFRDLKFGLMIHWGPYAQWGVVESWSLCREDEPWCRRDIDDYDEYRRRYEALPATFAPHDFDPDGWADLARDAGMRYVVFTTKHHDGFCMYDTRLTDYRVTASGCPFSADPRADIAAEVFRAFRARGFGVGAYFSKPDWHHPDYWAPELPNPDRNVNYDTARHPDRWRRFRDFTRGQIEELAARYGPLDILWLDGGWVRPLDTIDDKVRDWCVCPHDQDIDLPAIARAARAHAPDLLIVDRTVPGEFENYVTPEQEVPDTPPDGPWESCVTMGSSWSWNPDDTLKSSGELIRLLVEIVSRGGNLLLNVAPDARGRLSAETRARLADIAAWMRVNGEAIHGTRPRAVRAEGDLRFTTGRDGTLYVIAFAARDGAPPERVDCALATDERVRAVDLLGAAEPPRWSAADGRLTVELPASARTYPPCAHAWTLRVCFSQ